MFARLLLLFLFAAAPQTAHAQVAVADSGDTGWMMLCALLILFAALPGLMLRHAGLVGARNALAVPAQGVAVAAGVSLAWAIAGYSLAYAPGSAWLGGGANLLLERLAVLREGLTVPESAFVLFQMGLAVFAACLLPGAVAERARIGWIAAFAPLWLIIVYAPLARGIWGGGWLADLGVIDFAGGLVVHGASGFSALALVLIIGRRQSATHVHHAPLLGMVGGVMLWIGWAGMVGGWALGATDGAVTAILNAHFAACAGVLTWMLGDRLIGGRVKATGLLSGGLAGLVAISASAGMVGPGGAMLAGLTGAIVSRLGKALLNGRIDDAADLFVIHGLSGIAGALLLPLLVQPALGGAGFDAGIGLRGAVLGQMVGVGVVALWATLGSAIIALLVSVVLPMRATAQEEADGLDVSQHGEHGWDFR